MSHKGINAPPHCWQIRWVAFMGWGLKNQYQMVGFTYGVMQMDKVVAGRVDQ